MPVVIMGLGSGALVFGMCKLGKVNTTPSIVFGIAIAVLVSLGEANFGWVLFSGTDQRK